MKMFPFLLIVFCIACPHFAEADEITVTSAADTGTGTLREALGLTSVDDEIVFAAGLDGATIRLTSGELFVTTEGVAIDASDLPSGITISGEFTSRVFNVQADAVVFDSLTIANGQAPGATPSQGSGQGGGIFVSSSGRLSLLRCTVRNNRAGDGFPNPTFNSGGAGGGISCVGTLTANGSTFYANAAGDGETDGVNDGNGGGGGAIFHSGTGPLTIRNSTFANNKAGDGGGSTGTGGSAGAIFSGASTTFINSTISGNASGSGGSGAPGDNGQGGGLFLNLGGSSATMTNTIVAGNSTGSAGSVQLNSSDIAFFGTAVTTTGVNLIGVGDGGSASFPAPPLPGDPNANGDLVGTAANPLQANLGPLTANGGPTLTLLPLPGSPAIDPDGGDAISTLLFDQRGFDRFVPDFVDIGAVEFNSDDQARLDAAAARALEVAALQKRIKTLKRKLKRAKRKKQDSRVKRLKKTIKRLRGRLSVL